MAMMLASRLCRAPVLQRSAINQLKIRIQMFFELSPERRTGGFHQNSSRRRTTLKERIMAPAEIQLSILKGAVAGDLLLEWEHCVTMAWGWARSRCY
ncbi:hypothetical protein NQ317_000403 [Molorchus minor]|uniref:Uncharacterized protein n=1 Tax=Molorchus minor TaxID=1323400 RepID=A0ABQ9JA36_9CUCU|nr:hypothetical protein NQ317_000403 [Molorchus minor]